MSDRIFFDDRIAGLRKSYGELVRDASALERIPSVVTGGDQYQMLVTLVAALCSDYDIAICHNNEMGPSEAGTVDDRSTEVKIWSSELWSRIATSRSKIGLFTSGTTGRARYIEHRIDTLVRSVRNSAKHQSDIWGLTYHPASFAGLQVVLQALCNANPLIRLAGLESTNVHDQIQSVGITHLSATPTWMRLIASDGIVHESVTSVTLGGEIADWRLIDQLSRSFPNAKIRNIYASTESGTVLQSDGELFHVPEQLANQFKVVDGILAVHCSLLAESIRGDESGEFHLTGDCVEVVTEAPLSFRFLARRDDWINVGGNKVNPHQIERLILSLDGVADVRVFGRKNSVVGNIVCCEIVRAVGSSIAQADIRRGLEKLVPSYMIPRMVEFVDSILRTATGKKSRTE